MMKEATQLRRRGIKLAGRYLFDVSQTPLFENEGIRVQKARTVPLGRRLARLAVLARFCVSLCRVFLASERAGDMVRGDRVAAMV